MVLSQEEEDYVNNLVVQLEAEKAKGTQQSRDLSQASMFTTGQDGNLIQWQLDLQEELERIEHLLKGHIIKKDDQGNEFWAEPDNTDEKPLNDHGVQLIMNVISSYLNRNTILSNYKDDVIDTKMLDLSTELADLMYMKYEEMGMDTPEKKRLYPIIIRQIVDTIHSAYLRAWHGGERESLRTARHVSQTIRPEFPGGQFNPQQPRRASVFKPWTWGR